MLPHVQKPNMFYAGRLLLTWCAKLFVTWSHLGSAPWKLAHMRYFVGHWMNLCVLRTKLNQSDEWTTLWREQQGKASLKKRKKTNQKKITADRVVMMMGAIQKSHNQAVNVVLNAVTLQSESMGIDSFIWKQPQVATRGSAGFFFCFIFINGEIKWMYSLTTSFSTDYQSCLLDNFSVCSQLYWTWHSFLTTFSKSNIPELCYCFFFSF